MKDKIAKIIRTVTVPPVLVAALVFILAALRSDVFQNRLQMLICIICLAIIPVLAYPLQPLIPSMRSLGREGQRKLAFILSLAGYTAGMAIGFITHVSDSLQFIYDTYFLSVMILVVFNKLMHLRASGHACSITGPLIFLVYFIGPAAVLPCVIIFLLIIWSSIVLKRHTPRDLALGSATCIISFIINYLIMSVLF